MRSAVILSIRCGLLVLAAAMIARTWVEAMDRLQPPLCAERMLVGTVAPGQLLRAGTTVVNSSDTQLVIWNRLRKCDRTSELPRSWIVPPQESRFISGEIAAPTHPGPFLQRIKFETSDPASPLLEIEVVGVVVDEAYQPAESAD